MAKSLGLPTFGRSRCVAINVCGSIETDDKDLLKLVGPERKTLVSTYPQGRDNNFIALITGGKPEGGKPEKHLHIDVFKKSLFKNSKSPVANCSINDIESCFERFIGLDVEAAVRGRFEVPVLEIPEDGLIRSNIFEVEDEQLRVKTSGTEYRIEGAPISRVSWRINTKGDKMYIEMESFIKTKISNKYITSLYTIMNDFFEVFVLEQR